jgi:hypothetical protein
MQEFRFERTTAAEPLINLTGARRILTAPIVYQGRRYVYWDAPDGYHGVNSRRRSCHAPAARPISSTSYRHPVKASSALPGPVTTGQYDSVPEVAVPTTASPPEYSRRE